MKSIFAARSVAQIFAGTQFIWNTRDTLETRKAIDTLEKQLTLEK